VLYLVNKFAYREKIVLKNCSVIILAAGNSSRFGLDDKLFSEIDGRYVIEITVKKFMDIESFDQIIVVSNERNFSKLESLFSTSYCAKIEVILGGMRRQDSVMQGLKHIRATENVIVHDGARPNLNTKIIYKGMELLEKEFGAIPVIPVRDALKRIKNNKVIDNIDRTELYNSQTPQFFRFNELLKSHTLIQETLSDDAAIFIKAGYSVNVFDGDVCNFKITYKEDLVLLNALYKSGNNE